LQKTWQCPRSKKKTGEDFDITRVGVANYQEFAERIEEMAFNAGDWIKLSAGNKEYRPSIVRLENINSPERSRNFIVVFEKLPGGNNVLSQQDLSLVYEDEMFNAGTNKFVFKAKDINNLPGFIF
jgi:hypothetical protein